MTAGSLRPAAREKLAKVAGVISGRSGLTLAVEGHTDNVGTDEYNQTLSERRGAAVRDYLTGQGIPEGSVTTRGLGESQPVASNENAAGRQENRRVELVVSGKMIGGGSWRTDSGGAMKLGLSARLARLYGFGVDGNSLYFGAEQPVGRIVLGCVSRNQAPSLRTEVSR